jgi:hypothetical protein
MNANISDSHVYLVSSQATPNVTPALDPEIAPQRVILVVSPDMAAQADALEKVYAPRGIAVERWPVNNPWDIEHLRQRFLELAVREDGRAPVLNVTGGTKPMAIAAYEVFRAAGWPIFYIHPELDRLVWMHPAHLPPRELANRIRLDAFLTAHGADPVERPAAFGMPERLQTLAEALIGEVERYRNALRLLNWAAGSAEGSLISPNLSAEQLRRDDVRDLLDWFEAEKLLKRRGERLHFASPEARFFVNGGWLEQYVYAVVQAVRREGPGIQDVSRGLEVSRQVGKERVRNELDVAFLAENRLYVIECKTRRFSEEPDTGGMGAEALYKLETIANVLGGLQARAMLASYQPLDPAVRRRAEDYRILTCSGAELQNLKARLRRWIGG